MTTAVSAPIVDLYLGNTVYLPLRLRTHGQRSGRNVSTAQKIAVEFARVGEPPLPPVFASRTALGADWQTGRVPVLVSPADLTARVGTYDVTVTLFDAPTEISASVGRVEVLPRPIAGLLNLPTGGSYATTNLLSAPNAGLATIPAGAPVAHTANGLVLATAAAGGVLEADGVCVAATGAGATCLYMATGSLRLADWTAVFGSPSLPPGGTLYLANTNGQLTVTVPTGPSAGLLQVIGEVAADAQTLILDMDYAVSL